MELFGDGCAADHAAPLQHRDLEPAGGQVGRADEAVVPAADDERVAIRGGCRHVAALVDVKRARIVAAATGTAFH